MAGETGKAAKRPVGRPRMRPDAGPKPVRPVSNAFAILRYLSGQSRPVRSAQIARDLRVNPSTCFNILRTLVRERMLDFEPQGKTYTLGPGVVELAEHMLARGGALRAAMPLMERVARKHGITVGLWQRVDDNRMMLVGAAENEADMHIQLRVGQRLPLLCGALGRLMARHGGLDRAELKQRFDALRWQKPLRFDAFMAEADAAYRRGWAIDDGYYAKGVLTISAPVFERETPVRLTCGATMFSGQFDNAGLKAIADDMVALGNSLSRLLGGK
jgi:DNA-binding IclR family transcriptional regulator